MPDVIRVVAAVIKRNDYYLICKRPKDKRHGGLWEFPGGKVEESENIETAARRELAEELNLSVLSFGKHLYVGSDPGSPFEIEFVEVHVEGDAAALEHDELRWVPLDGLESFELAPVDYLFVRHLLNREVG